MRTNLFFEAYPFFFLFDLLRYLLPAGASYVVFWMIFKKRWKHLFIQKIFPVNSELWRELKYSISTVIIFSLVGFGIYSANKIGYIMIYGNIDDYGWLYFFISFIIMIVFHDFYFYWTHRLMHTKALFKYVHKVHHQSTNPSPWAAYSFHPFEAFIHAMVLPIILIFLPVHGSTVFLFTLYMILQNVRGHLGYEFLPRGFIKTRLFNWNLTTVHHNMHHKYFNYNFGLYFIWWDKWMNTNHPAYEESYEEVTSRLPERSCPMKTSKKIVTLLFLTTLSVHALSQSPEGTWMTFDESTGNPISQIKIENTPGGMEGKIIKIILQPFQGDDPICTKCEGSRKNQKIIGMGFLWGFKKSDTEWSGGKILDPESGKVYECRIWLENENTLMVRGYVGQFNLFYRTQTWKRAEGSINIENPEGTWLTIDDHWNKIKSLVEIKMPGGELKGTIKKIYLLPNEGDNLVCTECKGELKGKKLVGMKMLWGFVKQENKWIDGEILDPENGNTYSSSMFLIDKNTLKVTGYWGPFHRTQIWKRVIAGQTAK